MEALFLRAFCHDFWGLNRPEACRRVFESVISRFPDTPWEKAARAAIAANKTAIDAFNHPEKAKAELAEAQRRADEEFDERLQSVFNRCDTDGDQKLNPIETGSLWSVLSLYFQGGVELQRKRPLYNTNRDSYLDTTEFKVLAEDLRKARLAAERKTDNPRVR